MDRILKAARASGSLNLSNRSLREVPDEVYANLEAAGEGEKWWEAVELHKLILAHNSIEVLKEELRNLPQLTVLNISHNKLTHLPQAVGQLPSLKLLDVSFNSIVDVPEEIGSATSLVNFNRSSFFPLSWFYRFDCSNNQLKELPRSLGNCINMSYFKASNNSISCLPEELMSWSRMTKLDIEGNKLTTLSEKLVASWAMLTELNASKNMLDSIPESIGNLSHLIRLDLHQNKAGSATSVKEDIIVKATRLSISSKELSLQNLGLTAVPSEVWESNDIAKLDLSKNSIEELPVELSSCSTLQLVDDQTYFHLQVLILSRNKIAEWPSAMFKSLSNLTCLKLDNNPLKQIPADGLSFLQNLQILDLSGNAITLPQLTRQLQELYLRRMQLREVPSDVLSLHQLRILDLSQNYLQSIPQGIKALTCLNELDLSDNNISSLPPELGLLEPNLQALRVDGNPLRSIRRAIVERGSKAILNYLKDKLPEN
uniref:Leucine-rich repeat-containing protein 40 n=1 Tax=Kalanchoe fedtschenkoi TaxID=63787 RepID=A0A7N0SXY6_KALFE